MRRNLIPKGMVDRAGLIRWFEEEFDYRPGFYTINAAMRQGLPCEPHPLLEGKPIFNIEKVRAWMVERRSSRIQAAPLPAVLAP